MLNHSTAYAVLLAAIAMVTGLFWLGFRDNIDDDDDNNSYNENSPPTGHPGPATSFKNTKKQILFSKHKTPYTIISCENRPGFISVRKLEVRELFIFFFSPLKFSHFSM